MNSPRIPRVPRARTVIAHVVSASLLLQVVLPASAAITDIDSIPLGTYNAAPPRANMMYILDDSGSMERAYVPENTGGTAVYTGLCFGYSNLNKLFYDPYTEYVLPPKANFTTDGNYTASALSGLLGDGYDSNSTKYDFSTPPVWSNAGAPTWPAKAGNNYYYTVPTAGVAMSTCDTKQLTMVTALTDISAAKRADGKAVIDQKSNYAIWFSFYRTRILAMRSASGRVLSSIDATKFRVGFSTINETSTSNTAEYQKIGDFDGDSVDGTKSTTQRTRILQKIYATKASGSTPLRVALVKAGRNYANDTTAIQYTCQRSYAILTTDGYWNTAAEPKDYIPLKIDGTKFSSSTGDSGQPSPFGDVYPYTLADIAYYYNNTDLRTDLANNIKATTTDPNQFQHMTTYTLGLGVTGTVVYKANYTDDDLAAALKTSNGWPTALTDPLSTSDNVPGRIDDLWHAAVNGRGRYYAASKPQEVVDSLKSALDKISEEVGLAAAATTSSISPTVGDDQIFVPGYQHEADIPWQGSLQGYTLKFDEKKNILTPDLSKPDWSAQKLLDARQPDTRTILFSNKGVLKPFTIDEVNKTTYKTLFEDRCATNAAASAKLSQCGSLTTGALAKVTSTNLINYLRGDSTLYLGDSANDNKVFRTRKSRLGDIINSSPVAVGKPPFEYTDDGYSAFVTDMTVTKPRPRMVYVGANDGMLHAFYATGTDAGKEAWAYLPTAVLPNLWKLADMNYDANHLAFVDQTPTLADVKFASDGKWHTVLVGGLGSGGRQYYAIDVTDPLAPKLLWEFGPGVTSPASDAVNLGLTYGNPVVTKFTDNGDKWYAVFTSGYNNHLDGGDGKGYLYALDVETGAKKWIIKTDDVGTKTLPTNFGKINSWIHTDTNNTTIRFYGGDMQGRMWRIENLPAASPTVTLLGTALDAKGKKQPITIRPVLTALAKDRVANDGTFVSFGTGKYLSPKDLSLELDTSTFSNQQSIYLVKDDAKASAKGNLRSTLTSLSPKAEEATYSGSYATLPGFYVDTPDKGERVVVDGQQFNGLISFASSIPQTTANTDPCLTGGQSTLYYFNVRTGAYFKEAGVPLVVGGTRVFRDPGDGSEGGSIIWTTNSGTYKKDVSGVGGAAEGSKLRRSSWREIVE